ncbi:MAG: M20/M25/M40 family metallo-hydrolase [Deltaproteobacteria bacterium]|nr:M20/M25/M40 family metallo-hydrolase [Deltaproteobacteria bacterium]
MVPLLVACGRAPSAPDVATTPTATSSAAQPTAAPPEVDASATAPPPAEPRLADLRQLTFGGENAEAYWSFAGDELVMQARVGEAQCDRIYRLPLTGAGPDGKALVPVSSGLGATTCSYFMKGDGRVVYASTHLGGDACPPKPDHSQGYVWALYDSYDIFSANKDGSDVVRLTDTPGYDAEATVCGVDGSIVFTSVRDGDIDLYRMNADGTDVRRLTSLPGYDGGAFFDRDCTRILWRASRPRTPKDLDDFKGLLAKGLVRPSKLELYVANADGSDPVQITYLDAASFAPYWHPSGTRVLFSSNAFDPKGREFDLWAIDVDGTDLERVTSTPGFDGFPMFSPDGATLAFASNRATAPGQRDTNVFLARWVEGVDRLEETAADRVAADVAWLADPARDGRGVGTPGLEAAGVYLEDRMRALGLAPDGDGGTYRQAFPVVTAIQAGDETSLAIEGDIVPRDAFVPMGFSAPHADVAGPIVFAGYGIVAADLGHDDYAALDVKDKIVLVRRFVPEPSTWSSQDKRRHGDIRQKAFHARQRGARALLVVDDPAPPEPAGSEGADWKAPAEAPLPALQPEGAGDAGIPVLVLKRDVGAPVVKKLVQGSALGAKVSTRLTTVTTDAFNVVGRIVARPADGQRAEGVVVVGAHYDHLGHGGKSSLAPGKDEPHVGADDNASGTAALLEIARALAPRAAELRRDVVLVAFSGEESGVLGSTHFTRARMAKGKADVVAMLNMDMVGRLRDNRLQVLGTDTSPDWLALLEPACDAARVGCAAAGDGGLGPSDQMPFYLAGAPVLHFFTGTHLDYHKPSDVAAKVNAGGAAQIARLVGELAAALAARDPIGYTPDAKGPAPRGDVRSFNASLGTIPDYAGPGPGKSGMLLAGVRPGGAADKAGLQRGDVLIKLGPADIKSVEDLMFVLNAARPGETTTAVVVREGKELAVEITYQEGSRPR